MTPPNPCSACTGPAVTATIDILESLLLPPIPIESRSEEDRIGPKRSAPAPAGALALANLSDFARGISLDLLPDDDVLLLNSENDAFLPPATPSVAWHRAVSE